MRAPIIADLYVSGGICDCGESSFCNHEDGIQCISCSMIYYEYEPPEYTPEEGTHIYKLRVDA